MQDIKLEDIATRIIEAILNEPHINKESLKSIIIPNLKIWLKKTDSYKKTGIPKIDKLNYTIAKRDIELKYWYKVTKQTCSTETLQYHYKQLAKELSDSGFDI